MSQPHSAVVMSHCTGHVMAAWSCDWSGNAAVQWSGHVSIVVNVTVQWSRITLLWWQCYGHVTVLWSRHSADVISHSHVHSCAL